MATTHTSGTRTKSLATGRKGKRTFSLSVEALAFLDGLAKDHRSTSEALEGLIREKKEEADKARVGAGIRNYYDSISDEERAEDLAWGELAGSHFLKE